MRKLGKTLDPGLRRGDVSEGSGQSLVTPPSIWREKYMYPVTDKRIIRFS